MDRTFCILTPLGDELEVRASFHLTPSSPGRLQGPPEDCEPPTPAEAELLHWEPNEESTLAACINTLLKIRNTDGKSSKSGQMAHEILFPIEEAIDTYAYEHADTWHREDRDWHACEHADV